VSYLGWYGSIHTFTFTNDRYARAFEAMNAAKLVRDGEVSY
jgi:hypothetical protein